MTSALYERKLKLFKELNRLSKEMASFSVEQLLNDEEALARLRTLVQERSQIMAEIDQLTAAVSRKAIVFDGEAKRVLRREGEAARKQQVIVENIVLVVLDALKERTKKLREGKQSQRAYAGRIPSTEGSFIDERR